MGKIKFCILLFCIVYLATVAKAQEVDQNLLLDSISVYKPIAKTGIQFRLLPIVNKFQYVGDHPYDWNDGAMIQAKGGQQYLNAGVNLKWKQFELQIAPELVAAQNLSFEGFSADMDPVQWKDYYRFYNHVELPERFSDQPYTKFFGGQSFLKYQFKNTVLQFSTANKWWGPGYRNALVLSNNAGGFPHLSLANKKPIQTKIGAFNYEFIWGQLRNSNTPPPLSYLTFRGNKLYAPKQDRVRAFQGMHINYTPTWFTNLTLGLEQSFVQYSGELSGLGAYLPIKNIVHRLPNDLPVQPIILTALYFNYQLPAVQAKLYGEFGWNVNQTTARNFMLEPDKGMGSVLGFSKLFPTTKKHYWEFVAEMTNLQLQTRAEQFTSGAPPSWYLGAYVRQGYTHNGQVIGAGIGPGATSQTIELNWRKAKNRIGLSAERRLHNNDFYVYSFTNSGDYRRWYVDFATTLKIDWTFGRWDFSPRLSYIQTNNYNWWLFQPETIYFVPGKDKQQFIGQLNFTYHL
jgi:Capsule assembly protein Wzi